MVKLNIKLKRIMNVNNMVANTLPRRPRPPPTLVVKRSKFNFFRNGQIVYQINAITKCSNMVANILTATHLTLGVNRS